MQDFDKDVTVAGTAEQLGANDLQVDSAVIQAKEGNTGKIFLGSSSVGNDGQSGTFLTSGGTYNLSLAGISGKYNLETIYLNAEVSGEGVTVTYFKS